MDRVILITPTGCRPEAFALCEKYMSRQTYKAEKVWIVVDDYQAEPTNCTQNQVRINAKLQWRKGINTQRPNMQEAIEYIRAQKLTGWVFIIEDDDYYAPNYIEVMMRFLRYYDFVGETNSRYYAIKERSYKEWSNYLHASLCETAFNAKHLDVFEDANNSGELFTDCMLWKFVRDRNISNHRFEHENLACGIKQMPGRMGIGAGHTPKEQRFSSDPGFKKLKEWLGEQDAKVYMEIAMRKI